MIFMLYPVPMQKVVVIGEKDKEDEIIRRLHELGVLHITKTTLEGLKEDGARPDFAWVSSRLLKIRSFLKLLEEEGYGKEIEECGPFEWRNSKEIVSWAKRVDQWEKKRELLDNLTKEHKNLETQLADIARKKALMKRLMVFKDIDFSKLDAEHISYYLAEVSEKTDHVLLERELKKHLKKKGVVKKIVNKGDVLFLVIFDKEYDPLFILEKFDAKRIVLPEGTTTPVKTLKRLEKREKEIKSRIAEIKKEVANIAANIPELKQIEEALSILAERSSISLKFATTDNIFVVSGWMEKEIVDKVKRDLKDRFGSAVDLICVKEEKKQPPVILRNLWIVKPFEYLATFLSLPGKYDFDPSLIMFFFLPIMYGMILGDVGYSLISAILAYYIIKHYKDEMFVNVAKIWYYSAIVGAIWGVIFDEWFGMTHVELLRLLHEWGLPVPVHAFYHGISRPHNLQFVLGLTLIVGFIQVFLGFLLGAIVKWKQGEKKHAYGKIAWAGFVLFGSAYLCASFFHLLPMMVGNVAFVLLVISAIIIVWADGFMGVFEMPGVLANVLSYTRIAAAGVAGVILALLIDQKFAPHPTLGFLNLAILPIFIILHVMNAALAMFESIVQAGRLNIVEFFSKFYEGGGKPFRPFSLRLRHKLR